MGTSTRSPISKKPLGSRFSRGVILPGHPTATGSSDRGRNRWVEKARSLNDGGRDRDRTCDPLDVNEVLSR
jgi:hypothetical protein